MKIKELIEELQKYNPDGQVSIGLESNSGKKLSYSERKVLDVKSDGCGMVNAIILG